jgi:FtsP/CotA-like multicopper oxidase with cupredoxin domain
MRTFVVGLAAAGALIACTNTNDVSVTAKLSLNKHQAQWEQRTFSSYEFDLVQEKFGGTSDVHVTVHGTTIASVIDNATHEPPTVDRGWVTVDDLFADAQAAFGQKNTTLQMEFNEQYGYPTTVEISSNTPAGPYSAHLSNLVPLP